MEFPIIPPRILLVVCEPSSQILQCHTPPSTMGGVASVLSRIRGVHVAGAVAASSAAWMLSRMDCDVHTWRARIKRDFYKDKVVWVTGASSGIGRAFCLVLAQLQAHVIISARREDVLIELRKELLALGARSVHVVVVDLAAGEEEVVKAAKSALDYHGGRLDCLVNNAGVSSRASAASMTLPSSRKLMEINFFAPITLARQCLPALRNSNCGIIINTSSIASYIPTPWRSSYAASKAALDNYFTAFAYENADIHVLALCPGHTQSNVSLNALGPGGGTWGKMDEAIATGLPAERVAERALAAASCGIREAWVACGKELMATRIACYAPDVWARMSPKLLRDYVNELRRSED